MEIKKGDRLKVILDGIGKEGSLMTKIDGHIIFIKENVREMDITRPIKIQITKVTEKFSFAKLL